MQEKKTWIYLVAILLLALSIRIIYLKQMTSTLVFPDLALDSNQYNTLALQKLKGYPSKEAIYMSPFYPFFLTTVYSVFGYHPENVVYIQAGVDILNCFLVYYLAFLLFSRKVGLIAAFIYACYGIIVFYTGILLASSLILFLFLGSMALFVMAKQQESQVFFWLSGILLAFAILARPNIIFILPFLLVWLWKEKEQQEVYPGLFLLGFAVVFALALLKNYKTTGEIMISAQGGINFYIGNHPGANGGFVPLNKISSSPIEQIKTSIKRAQKESGKELTVGQASHYWFKKGFIFLIKNPLTAIGLYLKKFALFWRREEISLNFNYSLSRTLVSVFWLPFFSFGFIAPLALIGFFFSLKNKNAQCVIGVIICYMLSVLLFFVTARYRLPVVPFLIIFAAFAIDQLIQKKFTKTNYIALIVLFVAINVPLKFFAPVAASTFHHNLGIIYLNKNLPQQAIAQFKTVLKLDPKYPQGHNSLASAYIRAGKFSKALETLNKIKPKDAKVYNNLGYTYFKMKQSSKALELYQKALKLDPNYTDVYIKLGYHYHALGKYKKALTLYQKALHLKPNALETHSRMAELYLQQKKIAKAISHYHQAIEINPAIAANYNNLALAYSKKQMWNKAVFYCHSALKINPNLLEAHLNLANIYYQNKLFARATSCYQKALDIDFKSFSAYYGLAVIFHHLKKYKLAILNYDKAIKCGFKGDRRLEQALKRYR